MPVFYIDAIALFRVHPTKCIETLAAYLKENCNEALAGDKYALRWTTMVEEHKANLSLSVKQALPASDDIVSFAYMMRRLRKACPVDTVWVV